MLAASRNAVILRALAGGPRRQTDLRLEAGSPAQTTLRGQLRKLEQMRVLEKRRHNRFPGVHEYELTAVGGELLAVADRLESWLGAAPNGPLTLGGSEAKAAVTALAQAWSASMLRALAAGPISLTELDRVIGSLSYPSLERRLAAMRLTGQIEARRADGRGTPYAVTRWLRLGVGPLLAAARWERRHMPRETPPLGRLEAEAAFLLAAPLIAPPDELAGTCRLAVEMRSGSARRYAGVTIEFHAGEMVGCGTELRIGADASAMGTPSAWLDAIVERNDGGLELGGDNRLARTTVACLGDALFGPHLYSAHDHAHEN